MVFIFSFSCGCDLEVVFNVGRMKMCTDLGVVFDVRKCKICTHLDVVFHVGTVVHRHGCSFRCGNS